MPWHQHELRETGALWNRVLSVMDMLKRTIRTFALVFVLLIIIVSVARSDLSDRFGKTGKYGSLEYVPAQSFQLKKI